MKQSARLVAVLALTLCGGCASFQKKWDAAGQPGRYADVSRWDGRWTSERHHRLAGVPEGGRLRCVLEPARDGQMVAHFRANWKIFAANYDVIFSPEKSRGAVKSGGAMAFSGSHDLAKMFGGTYRYEAWIVGGHFHARYDSSYDSGVFVMTRQLTNATPIH